MGTGRSRFQGLKNVVRFNYPLYARALLLLATGAIALHFFNGTMYAIILAALALAVLQLCVSLAASGIAYDGSRFYDLHFLPAKLPAAARILNLNAGFDECSGLIAARYPKASVQPYDFFDPQRHTEPSIRRARAAYPPAPGTRSIRTRSVPEPAASADLICVILAAHEIRNATERREFLRELKRILKPDGRLIITEHLRDGPNILAYNVGALHFFSAQQWRADFQAAGLIIQSSRQINTFIHNFTLKRGDDSTS